VQQFEIDQFYARQMHLLDDGRAESWAGTFTADATFVSPSMTAPVAGRTAIASGARAAVDARAAAGTIHRHWVTMTVADDLGDHVTATSYVQVLEAGSASATRIGLSCVMRDELVREDDQLRVRARRITRDDIPAG
jgi:hypothetical protein